MTVPFGPLPGDPDADVLDALLDSVLSGRHPKPATLLASDEAVSLAESTRGLAGLLNGPEISADTYLNADPPELHWAEVLRTAYPASSHRDDPGRLSPVASPQTQLQRAPGGASHRSLAISAIALLFLLFASFTGGWWLGQRGSGGDGTAVTSVATTAGDEITPYSTAYSEPDGEAGFIFPGMCGNASPISPGTSSTCTGSFHVRRMSGSESERALPGGTNAMVIGLQRSEVV